MAHTKSQKIEAGGYTGTEFRAKWYFIPHNIRLLEVFRLETDICAVETHHIH